MSKKSFKRTTNEKRVVAELSKIIDKGQSSEKKLYNIYKLK